MLIDGDNAQHSLVKQMFEMSIRYGDVTIRRAYGDWTQPNLANWRPVMLAHAIQPIQQWRYTVGKNATDSALIIDAMDILYSGRVQGFCIISTDSDYTRLCTRIRESGLFVMGIGKQHTHEAFVNACNVFVYVENLVQPSEEKNSEGVQQATPVEVKNNNATPADAPAPLQIQQPTPVEVKSNPKPIEAIAVKPAEQAAVLTTTPKPAESVKAIPQPVVSIKPSTTIQTPTANKGTASEKALLKVLKQAFEIAEKDTEGWVHLGQLGTVLRRVEPKFTTKTYGFKNLSLLVKSLPKEISIKGMKKTGTSTIHVRMKKE